MDFIKYLEKHERVRNLLWLDSIKAAKQTKTTATIELNLEKYFKEGIPENPFTVHRDVAEDLIDSLSNLLEEESMYCESGEQSTIIYANNLPLIEVDQHEDKIVIGAFQKEFKTLNKEVEKNKLKGNRKPSGFAKPTQVSTELCNFMKKDIGTEIARTEVTQYIIQYIKDNELQNPINKKIIKPNIELKELLGVSDDDEITFFTLQKYMNKHFNTNENIKEI